MPEERELTDHEKLIQSLLVGILSEHIGHEHRITRAELRQEVQRRLGASVGDRKMRNLLEAVRNEPRGCWIVGSRASGYFTAIDVDELEKFLASDRNLIARLSTRIRNQEKHAFRQEPEQKARLKNPDQMPLAL